MAVTLKVKVNDNVTPFLRSMSRNLNDEMREVMTRGTNKMVQSAKSYVDEAMKKSYGSTGLLASSITSSALTRNNSIYAWRVFVEGSAASYANELESAKGLPRNRRNSGKLASWVERVNSGSDQKVPIRKGNIVRVGEGKSPYSVYSKYPNGILFMQRAFEKEEPIILSEIDSIVNKNIS